jgi:hypothetical protein
MDTICLNDVKSIIHRDGGYHISIFMPTHHRGGVDQQDPIRLRNLLRTAEEKMIARGLRPAEARQILKPAESLLIDNLFWRQQSDGLALFIDSNMYLYYRVPLLLKEEVGIGERFYIKPLVSLLSDCGWFYVLAISQGEIRLLQCTAFGSVRKELNGLPKNITEALHYETPDNRIQYHVPAPAGGSNFGGATAIQTGEGSRPDYAKRNIMQYLGQIGKGVRTILKEERAPLVLAAVDYLHPMYREANLYRGLLPEGILGSPEGVSDVTLREQAWTIVRPYFEKAQRDAVAEFNKSAGTGFTATGLNDVVPAAYHGRVRFLFIPEGVQQWGNFQPESGAVIVHTPPEPDDEDLMDLAAYQALHHAGTIYVLKPEEIPGKAMISAILRF